jgi:hypothetical protein
MGRVASHGAGDSVFAGTRPLDVNPAVAHFAQRGTWSVDQGLMNREFGNPIAPRPTLVGELANCGECFDCGI